MRIWVMNESNHWQPEASHKQMSKNLHNLPLLCWGDCREGLSTHMWSLLVSLAIQELKSDGVCFTNTSLEIWCMLASRAICLLNLPFYRKVKKGTINSSVCLYSSSCDEAWILQFHATLTSASFLHNNPQCGWKILKVPSFPSLSFCPIFVIIEDKNLFRVHSVTKLFFLEVWVCFSLK